MFGGPHPYDDLSLFWLGLLTAVFQIGVHLLMIRKPALCQGWLTKLPRHQNAGVWVMGVALVWFWILIAPENMAVIGKMSLDLGEFDRLKPWLRLIVPLAFLGMVVYANEFLFVRGLGVFALMVAGPLLECAQFKEPTSRLLLVVYAYLLLTKGMFWVGMPFLFRDAVAWATAKEERWKMLSWAGLAFGVLLLACALAFWRGY